MARHEWITPEDEKVMVEFYNQFPLRIKGLTGEGLVENIEWRIYTEWCCNWEESTRGQHRHYNGWAFDKWIEDETHYALEREGFEWDSEEERFIADEKTFPQIYKETRETVLKATVFRAVEFFKECEKYRWPHKGDSRNLRTPLKTYILHLDFY